MILNSAEQQLKHLPRSVLVLYGQAVQLIAGADGRLSYAELELLYDTATLRGIPEDIVQEWRQFNWRENTVEDLLLDLLPQLTDKTVKLLLLDAVRIAKADGVYPHEEEEAVRNAADALGIEEAQVVEIEILASLEKNIRDLQSLLLDV